MTASCRETATVTHALPNGDVLVRVRQAEACHACEARGTCASLGGQSRDLVLRLTNPLGARPGDLVAVSMAEASVAKASAVLYLLPALGLLLGALLGQGSGLGAGEGGALLGSLAGLVAGLLLARVVGRWLGRRQGYRPRLVAIMAANRGAGTD